jgi:hypothetical protein
MTHEQRTERIRTLTRELSTLLAQEAPRLPAVRMISAHEAPQPVRQWLLEQLRRANAQDNPSVH